MKSLCTFLPTCAMIAGALAPFAAKAESPTPNILKSGLEKGDWLRIFGSPQKDVANKIAVNQKGDICVVGTAGGAFPFAQGYAGEDDAFVTCYNRDHELLFTSFVGHGYNDTGMGLAMATGHLNEDYVYITGGKAKDDGNKQVFVAKFLIPNNPLPIPNPALCNNTWDLDGAIEEEGRALSFSANDRLYLAGYSSNGGPGDAFIQRVSVHTCKPLFKRVYLPGLGDDNVRDIQARIIDDYLDPDDEHFTADAKGHFFKGEIYITGSSDSTFAGAPKLPNSGHDAFVARWNGNAWTVRTISRPGEDIANDITQSYDSGEIAIAGTLNMKDCFHHHPKAENDTEHPNMCDKDGPRAFYAVYDRDLNSANPPFVNDYTSMGSGITFSDGTWWDPGIVQNRLYISGSFLPQHPKDSHSWGWAGIVWKSDDIYGGFPKNPAKWRVIPSSWPVHNVQTTGVAFDSAAGLNGVFATGTTWGPIDGVTGFGSIDAFLRGFTAF